MTDTSTWESSERYLFVEGDISLYVDRRTPQAWCWKACVGDLVAEGDARDPAEGRLKAQRASILLSMLRSLKTGWESKSFSASKAWLEDVRQSLNHDRNAWGIMDLDLQSKLSLPVTSLDVSPTAASFLANVGAHYVGDVATASRERIFEWTRVRPDPPSTVADALDEIREAMREMGLDVGGTNSGSWSRPEPVERDHENGAACLYCDEPMHLETTGRTWCLNPECPGSAGNPRVHPTQSEAPVEDESEVDENVGFQAMFVHPNAEPYWVLIKGETDLVRAAEHCVDAARRHGVRFAGLQSWKRGQSDEVADYMMLVDGLFALRTLGGPLSVSTETEIAGIHATLWDRLSDEDRAKLDGPDGQIERSLAYWRDLRGDGKPPLASKARSALQELITAADDLLHWPVSSASSVAATEPERKARLSEALAAIPAIDEKGPFRSDQSSARVAVSSSFASMQVSGITGDALQLCLEVQGHQGHVWLDREAWEELGRKKGWIR